jgi:hypothetical protein
MTIVNRRNAILGWVVWQVAKRKARQKASMATSMPESKAGKGGAAASALAVAAGAILLLRRRRGGEESKT